VTLNRDEGSDGVQLTLVEARELRDALSALLAAAVPACLRVLSPRRGTAAPSLLLTQRGGAHSRPR